MRGETVSRKSFLSRAANLDFAKPISHRRFFIKRIPTGSPWEVIGSKLTPQCGCLLWARAVPARGNGTERYREGEHQGGRHHSSDAL